MYKKNEITIKHIFIFFLVSLIIISVVFFIYFSKTIIGYSVYLVDYNVGDVAGFNLDTDGVHFGTVSKGVSINRFLTVSTNEDARVDIYFKGIKYLGVDNSTFLLKKGEEKQVQIYLKIPRNVEEGYYSGKMVVVYRKPKNI